jgi:thiol-disulfide isomerase/thioredoxin
MKYLDNNLIISFYFFLSLTSCFNRSGNQIEIVGKVKNIPVNKIYLTYAYDIEKFIDSADYTNGEFHFVLDTAKFKEPFFASICVKTKANKIEQLILINYKKTTSKDTFGNSGFMLSWGTTRISGDYTDKFHRVNIKPNSENDLLFDPKTELNSSISSIGKVISENPLSYYLLGRVYQSRQQYSSSEILSLIKLFNNRLQDSPTASLLKQYASNLTKKGDAFENTQLLTPEGNSEFLFDRIDSAKLTMLIFWASWCGPCRLEIPDLKEINQAFSKSKLEMKSISIDENISSWEKALSEETMIWDQYIVSANEMFDFKARFSISAIPTIIFIDKNKREVKRFIGYSKENTSQYVKFIENYSLK